MAEEVTAAAAGGGGAGWGLAGVQAVSSLINLGVGLHAIDKQNRRAKEANDLAREQFEYEKNKYNDAKAGQAQGISSLGEGFANFNKKESQKDLGAQGLPQTQASTQGLANPSAAQNSAISQSSATSANAAPSLQTNAAQNAPAQNAQNLAAAPQNAPKDSESSAQEQRAELPTERL